MFARAIGRHTRRTFTASSGLLAALVVSMAISACGGGGGGDPASNSDPQAGNNQAQADQPEALITTPALSEASQSVNNSQTQTVSRTDAIRFLTQATFGPTEADIQRVMAIGFSAWIDEQFSNAVTHSFTNVDFLAARMRDLKAHTPSVTASTNEIVQGFYTRALTTPAQLKARVAFSLSEIFVVSLTDSALAFSPAYVAGYMDMLDRNVTGTYRNLLEGVAKSPAMGHYLTFTANLKEDPLTGRVPDENFAREIMQLFSIGLYQLNSDGTLKLQNGKPVETYGPEDIQGLAKVFTGWSWWHDAQFDNLTPWKCFYTTLSCRISGDMRNITLPMVSYADYHSTSAKTFLGTTIPAQTPADPETSLRIALDTIANHPNVAPFISKQLIQRLVTSNPSPAYVSRVASTFKSSGGSIPAVVKAILLDTEARDNSVAASDTFGKVKEPILRLTALLRAFKHKSDAMNVSTYVDEATAGPFVRYYDLGTAQDLGSTIGQTPYMAPSVFNFFRPGYVPPKTSTASAGLVAPEMQMVNEVSVTGYANAIMDGLLGGFGPWKRYDADGKCGILTSANANFPSCVVDDQYRRDVQFDFSSEVAIAGDAVALFNAVTNKLMGLPPSSSLKTQIVNAVSSMPTKTDGDLRNRVRATIFLVMVSPEFLIQK